MFTELAVALVLASLGQIDANIRLALGPMMSTPGGMMGPIASGASSGPPAIFYITTDDGSSILTDDAGTSRLTTQ